MVTNMSSESRFPIGSLFDKAVTIINILYLGMSSVLVNQSLYHVPRRS